MDTAGIQAFLAIVRHGSLTDAAHSLHVSQSTLSHRLSQLEKSVGMELIERGRGIRSLSLTSSGEHFLKIAQKWEELIEETKYIRTVKKQTITIGAVDSVHTFILPPVYEALNKHAPNMNIRLKTYIGTELYSMLDEDKIDVAFALFEKPMPNMIIKKFFSEPMVVVIHSEDKIKKQTVRLKDLNPYDELYHDWSPSFRAWYDHEKEGQDFLGIRLDSAGLIFTFMNMPNKWIIVPMSMAKRLTERAGHVLLYLENPPPQRVYYQIRPRYPRSNAVESLQLLDSYLQLIQPHH